MRESVRIAHQAIARIRELGEFGPYRVRDFKYVLPEKQEVKTSMEALIHHFKIVAHGFFPPAGEAYAAVEAPKGELGFYFVSDGSARPWRMKVRAPSFINLQALDDRSAAQAIRDNEIDIAIDLDGFTLNARLGVLAQRPAAPASPGAAARQPSPPAAGCAVPRQSFPG